MHDNTTERQHNRDVENKDTNADNNKIKNETTDHKTSNTKHDTTNEIIDNNTKTNEASQQLREKVQKHQNHRPTHQTPNKDQQQTSKPEKAVTILANSRTDKMKKQTHPKRMVNEDAKDEEHKTEEDDQHTMIDTENKIDDVTIPSDQEFGNLH